LSEADRLSATIQTDQEESEIFIRSQEVRDPVAESARYTFFFWLIAFASLMVFSKKSD
jgi:hypothetical protein